MTLHKLQADQVWAESRERAAEVIARLQSICADSRVRDETFALDWQFTGANGELRSTSTMRWSGRDVATP